MTFRVLLAIFWVIQPQAIQTFSLNSWVVTKPVMQRVTRHLADFTELRVSDNRFQGLSTRAMNGASAPTGRCSHLNATRHGTLRSAISVGAIWPSGFTHRAVSEVLAVNQSGPDAEFSAARQKH